MQGPLAELSGPWGCCRLTSPCTDHELTVGRGVEAGARGASQVSV